MNSIDSIPKTVNMINEIGLVFLKYFFKDTTLALSSVWISFVVLAIFSSSVAIASYYMTLSLFKMPPNKTFIYGQLIGVFLLSFLLFLDRDIAYTVTFLIAFLPATIFILGNTHSSFTDILKMKFSRIWIIPFLKSALLTVFIIGIRKGYEFFSDPETYSKYAIGKLLAYLVLAVVSAFCAYMLHEKKKK